MAKFDPYLQWLGIRSPERPPNHYRLLGVEPFESDADVIETAADRQMAHVRTFQNGSDAEVSQQILNELAAAKLCLLDPDRKAVYDANLQSRYFKDPPPVDPATIDIKATGARVTDVPEVAIEIDDQDDSFRLSRPKQSSRGVLGKRLVLGVLALGFVCAAGAVYRFTPWFSGTVADKPNLESEPLESKGDSTSNTQSDQSEDSPGDEDSDVTPPAEFSIEPDLDDDPSPTSPSLDNESPAPLQPNTLADEPAMTEEQTTPPANASEPAPWTRAARRKPFSFVTNSPLGAVAVALADRDLRTAQMVFETSLNSSIGVSFGTQLEPLLVSQEQFWSAVGEAVDELSTAAEIEYRGQPVQVVGRQGDSVQLQAANGQRQAFSLNSSDIDPDLAAGLVMYRYRESLPVAWRLIGSFLSIDRLGNVDIAQRYWRMAESNGVSATPDMRAFTFLSQAAGTDNQLGSQSDQGDVASPEMVGETLESIQITRHPIPGNHAARAAHKIVREDLAVFFANRTEQGQVALVNKLFASAHEERDRTVYVYALLDSALKVGIQQNRADTVLRALAEIARAYEFDFAAEAGPTLSRLQPSRDNDNRVVQAALDLGDEMITHEAFDLAKDLQSIAEARLKSVPEMTLNVQNFRSRLEQAVEISRFVADAKRTLAVNSKNPQANQALGIYYFVRREFKLGLPYLVRGEHQALQTLAMADLTANDESRPNVSLAQRWEEAAGDFDGVVKSSMLARAKFWVTAE